MPPIMHRTFVSVAVASVLLSGCPDVGKLSEQRASEVVKSLAPVVVGDAQQVRRGLPEGAAKLGATIDADPGANLAGLQRAIAGARSGVKDLDLAKSTFFSFVDPTGIVLRSEADPDSAAQKSILVPFPELKKALDPASGVVEQFGEMAELNGVKNKPDVEWVLAHPVKDASGGLKGMFVTGWSFRRYAYYLEESAKRELHDAAQKRGEKSVPLIYVFLLRGKKAYGAPLTPDVNADALEKLDLHGKTSAGPYRGQLTITERTFGVAAERTAELGADTAVAVLLSEI